MAHNPRRYLLLSLVFVVSLALSLLGIESSLSQDQERPSGSREETGTWADVDRLVSEQKFNQAFEIVDRLLEQYRSADDRDDWTRALVRGVQLRIGLHGYETAVRFLREQAWPEDSNSQIVLALFYAQALSDYYSAYSWEISQREAIATAIPADLKAWTRDQIYAEARRSYEELWQRRSELGSLPISRTSEYLEQGNYPAHVRGTLRDAVSYLYVALLADTSFWTPGQNNELYQLDLTDLLSDAAPVSAGNSDQPTIHPLARLTGVLKDLEHWHSRERRPEAALEARLERIRRLHSAFAQEEDRVTIRSSLEQLLPVYRGQEWWAVGQAFLAEMIRGETTPGKSARARSIARQGMLAYPDSIGGKRCESIVRSIEAPDFQLESMFTDAPQRRSIRVTHRNLKGLHFRAYAVDLLERLSESRDYNLLLNSDEQWQLAQTGKPVAEWSVELPLTPDFENHQTFVTPPLEVGGYYVLLSSATPDFRKTRNKLAGVNFIVSDLLLITRHEGDIEVQSVSGRTGRPVPGAQIDLYQADWQRGHRVVKTGITGQDGTLAFSPGGGSRHHYFLVGRHEGQISLSDRFGFATRQDPSQNRCLIYTDRSIYRPNQKILWKILAFRAEVENAHFQPGQDRRVVVQLKDANHQQVAEQVVRTNEFGTAAGEFLVPAGRVLGAWTIDTSFEGSVLVRVEEYKRPTFEVTLKDPETTLRLNRSATLVGEARYYFGLPLTSGSVQWRMTREPIYPWWQGWYSYRAAPSTGAQTVAAGSTELDDSGTFRVAFTPQADEREAAKSREVSYRYRLSTDVTDEGGETQSAERSFRIGFVSVEARVEADAGFFLEQTPIEMKIRRTNLDGTPRAGRGSWRLVSLQQPERTVPPADLPLPKQEEEQYQTPGDRMRPRWAPDYSTARELRSWPDGDEKGREETVHDPTGLASVRLGPLPSGPYRLHYRTTDDLGELYETSSEIVVVGSRTRLSLPALLMADKKTARVGETLRLVATSGLCDQPIRFEIHRSGRLVKRQQLNSERSSSLVEIPITEEDRGGFVVRLVAVRDHQIMFEELRVDVPWDNKQLKLEFSTFRDKLRPGSKETWRIKVRDPAGKEVGAKTAEVLAYMYDKSLDAFAPHSPADPLTLWPVRGRSALLRTTLDVSGPQWISYDLVRLPNYPDLHATELKFFPNYGLGGPGRRRERMLFSKGRNSTATNAIDGVASMELAMAPPPVPSAEEANDQGAVTADPTSTALRTTFSETAFWQPQLLTGPDGAVIVEFTVPDSVTTWNVWAHAIAKDFSSGSVHRAATSVKELMTRPYLPRFLREGDQAELKVVVNNAGDAEFQGDVRLEILDPDSNADLLASFGLSTAEAVQPFSVKPGQGTNVTFPLRAPSRVGSVAVRVVATSGNVSDGELRPLPLLPGRMHLSQSRFVTLRDHDRREIVFQDLRSDQDSSRIHEQMVVTIEAQLFYSVLSSLPYLVNYPYECTEQTLNRFVSSGILATLYQNYPAVARMAKELSARDTRLETWNDVDPNRKVAMEETPWLVQSRGGEPKSEDLVKILDPRVARAEREVALAKLRKAQTAIGGFPWFPGGPPSPYMTLYIMYGMAKAAEFGVEVPREMVEKGWRYLAQHFREDYPRRMREEDCCCEFLTFLNYVASCYPDPSWMGDALTHEERQDILRHCFKHWKQHSPYLKSQLALTLKRMGRGDDAALVFASVMDSARTTRDEGTFWAPEDRGWLWYNDTIETHAFALRTLMELLPSDARRDGLVHWLFLNKKLNHWKSTRATAEVIYALIHYLKKEGTLALPEQVSVTVGPRQTTIAFDPDRYTGHKNQVLLSGDEIVPASSTVVVEKATKGLMFASATWHFSTELLPEEGRGDLLSVARRYFKREKTAAGVVLEPLSEAGLIEPGDEIEVQLSIRSRHACEYIHLRDPRPAGLEPGTAVSRHKWDLGISWYEETRDSGTNFFFERLPAGEYILKYRLKANMGGVFRVSPATLQSMYAPEFTAYSSGEVVRIGGVRPVSETNQAKPQMPAGASSMLFPAGSRK